PREERARALGPALRHRDAGRDVPRGVEPMKILSIGRARQRKRHAARAGFTILEILIAMGILLFGMTAILGLLTFGAALGRTAQLRTSAAAVAEAVVADLEETLFPVKDGEAGEPAPLEGRA